MELFLFFYRNLSQDTEKKFLFSAFRNPPGRDNTIRDEESLSSSRCIYIVISFPASISPTDVTHVLRSESFSDTSATRPLAHSIIQEPVPLQEEGTVWIS